MNVDHAFMVLLAKSFGLICFVVASLLVLLYALRPSARERFERAGRSIIVDDTEDRPAVGERSPVGTGEAMADPSNGHAGGSDGRR